MRKKKVFVSFDYDHDKQYKFLLQAWDANPEFDFVFEDKTPGEINSNNVGRIKAGLTSKLNEATHTLFIVGKHANQLHRLRNQIGFVNWINFEAYQSREGDTVDLPQFHGHSKSGTIAPQQIQQIAPNRGQ